MGLDEVDGALVFHKQLTVEEKVRSWQSAASTCAISNGNGWSPLATGDGFQDGLESPRCSYTSLDYSVWTDGWYAGVTSV